MRRSLPILALVLAASPLDAVADSTSVGVAEVRTRRRDGPIAIDGLLNDGAWQSAPAIPPADELLRAGRDAFLRAGCGGCHTVRGTEAQGEIGPDLTHVGSRRTLAAGTLVNVPGAIETWIAHSQRIKPGSLMPSASQLPAHQLGALAAYLESLQ